MYVVYWSQVTEAGLVPQHQTFEQNELSQVLAFMEAKRTIERQDGSVAFIAMVSRNPNSVGNPGVDVTGPDYNWRKRRP